MPHDAQPAVFPDVRLSKPLRCRAFQSVKRALNLTAHRLEWSTDGGANWSAAPRIWDGTTQKWRNDLAFTGKNPSSPAFDLEKAAFQAPAGGSLQIRFRLSSDQLISSPVFTGAWVDDVALTQ